MVIAITPERLCPTLITSYNQLLGAGLSALHIRLPQASREEYEQAILGIKPEYRSRVVISDYYDLVKQAGLGGIHINRAKLSEWNDSWLDYGSISVSIHSLEEIDLLPCIPTYALAGPVFSSTSKEGYTPSQDWLSMRDRLVDIPFPLVALSGITPDKLSDCLSAGFSGVAVLGYFSEHSDCMLERFLRFERPKVLSLAGHDPSTGAGLTADCLTIEQAGARAISITTCLTSQDEQQFRSIHPLADDTWSIPLRQILRQGDVRSAKIGMVSSIEQAIGIAETLREYGVRWIIWDPILKASASSTALHQSNWDNQLNKMLNLVSLITPNYKEAEQIWGNDLSIDNLKAISQEHNVSILLKGGHRLLQPIDKLVSSDTLVCNDGTVHTMSVARSSSDKHGTGCKLSSMIAVHLARFRTLSQSVRLAQWEVDRYRRSHSSLYGYHIPTQRGNKPTQLPSPLMYITDSSDLEILLNKAKAALEAGVRWVQLRMKDSPFDTKLEAALALRQMISLYPEAVLIINDDVKIALVSNADGVHLGLTDTSPIEARKVLGPNKIIGGTCNTIQDLHRRALEGVDYVGVGPYRSTQTKQLLAPILDLEGLVQITQYNTTLPYPIPIWAIGGIVAEDLPTLSNIGLSGIALSGAINNSPTPKESALLLLNSLKKTFH